MNMFENLPPLERMKKFAEIENHAARETWGHVYAQLVSMKSARKGGRGPLVISDQTRANVIALKEAGKTKGQTREDLGVSDHLVRTVLRDYRRDKALAEKLRLIQGGKL